VPQAQAASQLLKPASAPPRSYDTDSNWSEVYLV